MNDDFIVQIKLRALDNFIVFLAICFKLTYEKLVISFVFTVYEYYCCALFIIIIQINTYCNKEMFICLFVFWINNVVKES